MHTSIYTEEYWNKDKKVIGFTQNKYINPILQKIHNIQTQHNIKGNVGEIGVHHGKSFIPLLMLLRDDEKGLAIDCYDQQQFNKDKSGKGSLKHLKQNCNLFGKWSQVKVLKGNSIKMNPKEWVMNECMFRIFSIDGSHTSHSTLIDLKNVASVVDKMGIIIIDDYLNLSWPGVRSGVDKFMSTTNEWRPIFLGYNKMFLCRREMYGRYWKIFSQVKDEILNKASSVYTSKIRDVSHFEERMKIGKVWKK